MIRPELYFDFRAAHLHPLKEPLDSSRPFLVLKIPKDDLREGQAKEDGKRKEQDDEKSLPNSLTHGGLLRREHKPFGR